MVSEGAIKVVVERIVQRFNPLRIILFGSHARNEATADSDVDLLVVLPRVDNSREIAVSIRRAVSDSKIPIDIVVTSPEEIGLRGHLVGTVLKPRWTKEDCSMKASSRTWIAVVGSTRLEQEDAYGERLAG